jgi:REP element-mobilizing transposase RayT
MGENRVELFVHVVWGTAGRLPSITPTIEGDLFGVIAVKTTELRCVPCAIGGTADHVHLLARLHTSISVARLIGEVKGASSHFVNHRLGAKETFAWQSGFGAFTIATDDVPTVSDYVRAQKQHHERRALEASLELADD